ncbi:rhodanese-like domain-containing protein [Streptomonospora salina]|uniref:Rhodanese-related sulfurtransferase n=1 Tax=Streptomonospora salina TaxID=104205 RepID=A0A841E8R7_9ACTN|nr:rhodanese-like domain-containing protein [Streptomonospora salina]MBB5998874.1 rhodanese-related sulfurtransferase [Streptomonospora salina]
MFAESVPVVEVGSVPPGGYLLDVREDDEWAAGHAPEAVHVPLGRLAERAGEIPQDRQVYVVCRVGGRSAQAVQALNEAGWQAANVAGGMQAWALAGGEMVSESGDEPRVA